LVLSDHQSLLTKLQPHNLTMTALLVPPQYRSTCYNLPCPIHNGM
jgi:hypothetical protein